VLVPVTAGELLLSVSGNETGQTLAPGEFAWRLTGEQYRLINTGASLFHAVEILIK
jgi:hypothetical protein